MQFDDAGDRELLQLGMQDDEDDELLKLEKELEEEQVSRGCVDRALDGWVNVCVWVNDWLRMVNESEK